MSDGAGGAIVTWQGNQNHVYSQRVSASGAVLFGTTGVRLTNGPGSENDPLIASDGAGGAVVAWIDSRAGSTSDVYAQRVNALGGRRWEAEGRALCTAASAQNFHTIAPGLPGSANVAWPDFRSNAGYDVYAGKPDSISVVPVGREMPVTGRVGTLRPNPTRGSGTGRAIAGSRLPPASTAFA